MGIIKCSFFPRYKNYKTLDFQKTLFIPDFIESASLNTLVARIESYKILFPDIGILIDQGEDSRGIVRWLKRNYLGDTYMKLRYLLILVFMKILQAKKDSDHSREFCFEL